MGQKPQITQSVREYLAAIGRRGGVIGGKSTSEAKIAASRENGKLGGRPPKKGKRQ